MIELRSILPAEDNFHIVDLTFQLANHRDFICAVRQSGASRPVASVSLREATQYTN